MEAIEETAQRLIPKFSKAAEYTPITRGRSDQPGLNVTATEPD